jgi:hypothetical protein
VALDGPVTEVMVGVVRSIVIVVVALVAEGGTLLLKESVTAFCANLGSSVPSEQLFTAMVKDEPVDVFGLNEHPEAVPALEKSLLVNPDTESEKVNE